MVARFVPGEGYIPANSGANFIRAAKATLEAADTTVPSHVRAQAAHEAFPGQLTPMYRQFGIIGGNGEILRLPSFMHAGALASRQHSVVLPAFIEDSVLLIVVETPPLDELDRLDQIEFAAAYLWEQPQDSWAGGYSVEGPLNLAYANTGRPTTRGSDYHFLKALAHGTQQLNYEGGLRARIIAPSLLATARAWASGETA